MTNPSSGSAAARQDAADAWYDAVNPLPLEDGAGRSAELDALYRTNSASLVRSIARRTGSRDDALEIVQDAFARLLGLHRNRASSIDRPEAYLHRVARNLLRDRAKMRARRSAHLHVVAESEHLAAPDQQHLLETRDMLRRLEAAMLKLKPRTREIFMAHRLDGMSYAEIAERTGLTVSGVEQQMSKAIAHIDRMLDRP